MKKLLPILCLICSLGVQAEKITCPQVITCNYDNGHCDISNDWFYFNMPMGEEAVPDDKPISLISANSYRTPNDSTLGYKPTLMKNDYILRCSYRYGNSSSLHVSRYVKNITGSNWNKYNFGKTHATCSDITNLDECSGDI